MPHLLFTIIFCSHAVISIFTSVSWFWVSCSSFPVLFSNSPLLCFPPVFIVSSSLICFTCVLSSCPYLCICSLRSSVSLQVVCYLFPSPALFSICASPCLPVSIVYPSFVSFPSLDGLLDFSLIDGFVFAWTSQPLFVFTT